MLSNFKRNARKFYLIYVLVSLVFLQVSLFDGSVIFFGVRPVEEIIADNMNNSEDLETFVGDNYSGLTDKPIGITVGGYSPNGIKSIDMVSYPINGINNIKLGEDERDLSIAGRYMIYDLDNINQLANNEAIVTFEAKHDYGDDPSVLYVTYASDGRGMYDFVFEEGEKETTDTFQSYEFVIPLESVPDDMETYKHLMIRKSEDYNNVVVRNVKLELGRGATPHTKNVNEVQMVTDNMFINGDFSQGRTNWLNQLSGVFSVNDGVLDASGSGRFYYNLVTLPVGEEYVLTFDAKKEGATSGVFVGQGNGRDNVGEVNVTNSWETYTIPFVSTNNYTISFHLRDTNNVHKFRNMRLERVGRKSKRFDVTSNGKYTFKIEDNLGNIEYVDKTVDNFYQIVGNPKYWIGSNANINVLGGSSVRRVKLPNGDWVNDSVAEYTISNNGEYTFVLESNAGEQVTKVLNVTNIDKVNPEIYVEQSITDWTNEAVDLKLSSFDEHSGVKSMEMTGSPSGEDGGRNLFRNSNFVYGTDNWVNENMKDLFVDNNTLNTSGSGRFFYSIILMPVGNTYTVSFDARKDGSPAGLYIGQGSGTSSIGEVEVGNEWSRYSLTFDSLNTWTVSFGLRDTQNLYQLRNMKLEIGDNATPWISAPEDGVGNTNSVYSVIENGTYEFTATDFAGNKGVIKHEVTNIDSNPPSVVDVDYNKSWTKEDELTFEMKVEDLQSGLKGVTLPDGRISKESTVEYVVTDNGKYSFTLEDNVGNRTTHVQEITNFDRVAPTLEITGNPTDYTDEDEVALTVNSMDSDSGVKAITTPDGEVHNMESVNYTIETNGTYEFSVEDNAGNVTTETIKVEYMMIPYSFYLYDNQGKPLKGAGFNLLRDGVVHAYAESDDDGLVDFGKVPPTGRYTIRQTKAPDGYVVNPEERDIDVEDTTDPEDFISYPRGTELPSTGTYSGVIIGGVILLTMLTLVVLVIVKHSYK